MDINYLLINFKNWVVIGDILNQDKYAYKILEKFKNKNYTVVGVHPKGGESIYKQLDEVPFKIDAIDLCINSVQGFKYIEKAKELGIKYIIIQPGAGSKEIIDFCKKFKMIAIEGCALMAL